MKLKFEVKKIKKKERKINWRIMKKNSTTRFLTCEVNIN